MINVTCFYFPLFECLLCQVMYLLKNFMPHLELIFLELAESPLISKSLNYRARLFKRPFKAINQGAKLKSVEQCLCKICCRSCEVYYNNFINSLFHIRLFSYIICINKQRIFGVVRCEDTLLSSDYDIKNNPREVECSDRQVKNIFIAQCYLI